VHPTAWIAERNVRIGAQPRLSLTPRCSNDA
jgi:hypothetical protein